MAYAQPGQCRTVWLGAAVECSLALANGACRHSVDDACSGRQENMTSSAIRKPDRVLRALVRSLAPACAVLLVANARLGLQRVRRCVGRPCRSTRRRAIPAAGASATYTVTYTGAWTAAATPGGVPDGAHFSPLIGGIHNADVAFLEAGGVATPGIESMAERGRTATLTKEIEAAGANALSVLRKESGSGATESSDIRGRRAHRPPSPRHSALDDRAEPGLVRRRLRSFPAQCRRRLGRGPDGGPPPVTMPGPRRGRSSRSTTRLPCRRAPSPASRAQASSRRNAPMATLTFTLQSAE